MTDPAFGADLAKIRLPLEPVAGEEVAQRLARIYALPPATIAAAKEMLGSTGN